MELKMEAAQAKARTASTSVKYCLQPCQRIVDDEIWSGFHFLCATRLQIQHANLVDQRSALSPGRCSAQGDGKTSVTRKISSLSNRSNQYRSHDVEY